MVCGRNSEVAFALRCVALGWVGLGWVDSAVSLDFLLFVYPTIDVLYLHDRVDCRLSGIWYTMFREIHSRVPGQPIFTWFSCLSDSWWLVGAYSREGAESAAYRIALPSKGW